MQNNITVPNGTGANVRANLNLAHQSLATDFYGATDPSTLSPSCSFPFSKWADTGNGLLKVRNNDDSAWIVIGTIDADGTPKITSNGFTVNASDVVNTPSGTISATDVQSALNSLNVLPLLLRSTIYAVDDVAFCIGLPSLTYLSCTTGGTTDSSAIVIPSPVDVGDTITDGTVTWTVKKIGSGGGGFSIGDIKMFAGNSTIEEGWLLCDGSALSRTTYADLFAVIGTDYGDGDGSTTFNIPDYTGGTFPEGDTTAGTAKSAGIPNIKGNFGCGYSSITWTGPFREGSWTDNRSGGSTKTAGYASFDASRSSSIYSDSITTVQPKSLTTRFIIKAYEA